MLSRQTDLIRIIGDEGYEKLRNIRVLLVGAGGIGSELLKNLTLMEFGEIHIVDLDTIDLSNLNRQFLFRQRDIRKPKSSTAVKAVEYYSNSKLIPYQGNIMDTNTFPLHWFQQFDVIFNALDNLAARRYVNKISQFLSLPLLESGTSGFDGHIQPIIPKQTECFDCTKKETPKTFPVCTIRSTPKQPIHCIVWAKNFLFNQLFASSDEENDTDAKNQNWGTDDPKEIERIKQETNELHELQNIVSTNDTGKVADIMIKLFINDINKLLKLENLWKSRTKPIPLTESLIHKSSTLDDKNASLSEIWSIEQQVARFLSVTIKLIERFQNEKSIQFDKDDQDTLEFVVTAANIRSHIFGIPMKSIFESKQMAGNIIPAIATTNAIIAGLSALISLRVLNLLSYAKAKKPTDLNMAFTAKASNLSQNRYITNPKLVPPSCICPVCAKVERAVLTINSKLLNEITLEQLGDQVRQKYSYPGDISILDSSKQRLLCDFDFDDLLSNSLSQLKLENGSLLLFTDDDLDETTDTMRKPFELYIVVDESYEGDKLNLPNIEIPMIKKSSDAEYKSDDDSKQEQNTSNDKIVIDIDIPSDISSNKKRVALEDQIENNQSLKKQRVNEQSAVEKIIELD